jgi:hypothetical protein
MTLFFVRASIVFHFKERVEMNRITFRMDYKPKNLDLQQLSGGKYVELLHVFTLDDVELSLESIQLTGIKGFKKLLAAIGQRWLPHVYNTQLPNVASGISGVRSLLNLSAGMADLILLPLDEYKREGKVVRGIQKGAKSFAKHAAAETVKLGSRFADGTLILLEKADDLLDSALRHQKGTLIAIPTEMQEEKVFLLEN